MSQRKIGKSAALGASYGESGWILRVAGEPDQQFSSYDEAHSRASCGGEPFEIIPLATAKTPTGRVAVGPNIQFLKPPMAPEALEMVKQIKEAVARHVGIDLASGADRSSIALRMGTRLMLSAGNGHPAAIDREWINGLDAGRKAERTLLALAFETIALAHGATVVRREEGRHVGWHSGSIDLTIALNGVGALVAFSNLHGGDRGLISWYNDRGAGLWHTRNFSGAFCGAVREYSARPHHKATTGGSDWHALATALDAGLCLANRGEAFEPSAT